MRDIFNGIEIQSINKLILGVMYLDNNHLYIANKINKYPIVIKNIKAETLKQIGEFFTNLGNYPERAATRIDFNNQYINLQIKVDKTYLYVIGKEVSLEFYPIGPTEMKKIGVWLRKKSKCTPWRLGCLSSLFFSSSINTRSVFLQSSCC